MKNNLGAPTKYVFNCNELYIKYIENNLSINKIAKIYNCSFETIRRALHKFNISVRTKEDGTRLFTKSNYFSKLRSKQSIGDKNNMFGKTNKWGHHTDSAKEKIRNTHSGINNPMFGKPSPKGAGIAKKSKYKNILFRSSYEVLFAKWLDNNNIKWQYESKTFNLGDSTYTPDFYLIEFNLYIEVKGYWREIAKRKFKLFEQKFSGERIKIVDKFELQSIGVL